MKKYILFLNIIIALLFTATSIKADPVIIFQQIYTRATGEPVTETYTFPATNGPATIVVTNGGLEDAEYEKVSSSHISLNGTDIFGSSDFNKNSYQIEKVVNLYEGINTIGVLLKSKPGGRLTVQVFTDEGNQETDSDGDGIPDAEDNCPDDANPDQADTDNDGVGDACDPTPTGDRDQDGIDDAVDNCPDDANPDQADTDNDGTGDVCDPTPTGDSDNDGVDNAVDNCPDIPNPDQADADNDGVGDACDPTPTGDRDQDGVDDTADNCPDDANPDQADTDNDGTGDICDPTPTGDRDNDGIDDAEDNCPDDANPNQVDTDNDGTGDICDPTPTGDRDNDGVDNTVDNCPDIPNPDQADTDNDGVGDACDDTPTGDRDEDGIDDAEDNCPDDANPDQADTDNDGTGDVCDDDSTLPPDPVTVAPSVDQTVATTMDAATQFLYTGGNSIQTGVNPGTIEPTRVAVLRGEVLDRSNNPLSGVTITILGHPEFGQTLSRTDGTIDMAVNGGGHLTVDYRKAGYLPVQRQVNVPWQDYALLPDIVMIPVDSQVTTIDLTSNVPMQVATGSVVTDDDGTRQAVLMIPQGTTAEITLPDGTKQSLNTLNLRATEYTVGSNGPETMPAQLPPTSGYTYAVELSSDEALANGIKVNGKDVVFNQPVPFYVDNFLNFPVGGIVPVGYYDNDKAAWIPYENGLIIEITGSNNGLANVDVDGDGSPDTGTALSDLNITDAEREQLAVLYSQGQSVWRVQLTHLSTWDHNWPFGPPPSAKKPPNRRPHRRYRYRPPAIPKPCKKTPFSIIELQSQGLGESVPITGTGFTLNYRSDRVPGHLESYTLEIPLSESTVPASLLSIVLEVSVAGQEFKQSFPPNPDQTNGKRVKSPIDCIR